MNKSALVFILFLNFTNSIKPISMFESNKAAKTALVASGAAATFGYIERQLAQKEINDLKKDKIRNEKISKRIADRLTDSFLINYKKLRFGVSTLVAIGMSTARLGLGIDSKAIAKARSKPKPGLQDAQEEVAGLIADINADIAKLQKNKRKATILFALGSTGVLLSGYNLFKKNYRIIKL